MIKMMGQDQLTHEISNQIEMGEFPQFSIISGQRGSGKKLLASLICNELDVFWCFVEDNKIETIRNKIKEAYKTTSPTCYIFTDVDTMSVQARNALLKIVEEPPTNVYFIMTVCDTNKILDTIKSRAIIYKMLPYKPSDIVAYAHDYTDDVDDEIVKEICETPGDVELLVKQGMKDLYEYVEKTVYNISQVSPANAFKISNKISFKDYEEGKFDVELFLRAFKSVCGHEMKLSALANNDFDTWWFSRGIEVATNALNKLQITGINKSAVFDMFILDIRGVWEDDIE